MIKNVNVVNGKQGFQPTTKGKNAPQVTGKHVNIVTPTPISETSAIREQYKKFQQLKQPSGDKLNKEQRDIFNTCIKNTISHASQTSKELEIYATHLPRGRTRELFKNIALACKSDFGRNLTMFEKEAQQDWTDKNALGYYRYVERMYQKSQHICNAIGSETRNSNNPNLSVAYKHATAIKDSLHKILATVERTTKH